MQYNVPHYDQGFNAPALCISAEITSTEYIYIMLAHTPIKRFASNEKNAISNSYFTFQRYKIFYGNSMNSLVLTWAELVHMPHWVSKQCSNVLGFRTDHQCPFSFFFENYATFMVSVYSEPTCCANLFTKCHRLHTECISRVLYI